MALTTEQKNHRKVRRAWIKALRSGNYKRGTGQLQYNNKFCCLGVLCDLAVKAKVIPEPVVSIGEYVCYGEDGEVYHLPQEVMQWAGLQSQKGDYKAKNGLFTDLEKRNDQGKSFEKIADIIEKNPEGLFVD